MNMFFSPKSRFHFAPIFNWLLRRTEVSAQAKLLYARLIQYSDDNGCAYPSRETLCEELALTGRSCDRYLQELREVGLIVVQRLGQGRANRYRFPEHPWMNHKVTEDDVDRAHKFDSPNMATQVEKFDSPNFDSPNMATLDSPNMATPIIKDNMKREMQCAREEIHTANFENLRSSAELPVNVKESSWTDKSHPHNLDYGKSGDVFEEDCEGRPGPHDKIITPPTQSVNASQSVNTSNTRRKNFTHQGENSPLDELYQVGVNELIPTAWFNIATRKNIPTDKVNDVFGKFKYFYRGREYTKIDWNEKWNRWCDNERQFKDTACQEEKPIEVVVDHSEPAEVRRVRQEILRIVGDATYKSWYASCEIKLSSTNIEITAPTKFNMTWIETNGKNLDSPLRASLGKNVVYKYKQQNPSREARMAS